MHLFGKSALALLFVINLINPNSEWLVSVNKSLVEEEKKNLTFSEKDLIIVISRNQCTRCNRSMIDLIDLLHESDKRVTIIRILDSSLMDCKQDEHFFRDEYPDVPFEYTSDRVLSLVKGNLDSVQVPLNNTPILIKLSDQVRVYDPDVIIDEYGRLRKFSIN